MSLEPLGILTLAAGLATLRYGPDFGVYIFLFSTLLGAAAALSLPALGGATVLSGHILLMFYALSVVRDPSGLRGALRALEFPSAGFWLLLIVVYGVLTAIFLPRIFAGQTEVYSLARVSPEAEIGIVAADLAPRSSNLTQMFYLASGLICFAAVSGHIARGGTPAIVSAVLVAALGNLVFASLDLATYWTGTSELLDPIRTASYRMLDEGEIGGLKRIVGSFSEAGAFGYTTLGFFGFAIYGWLHGLRSGVAGPLALVMLLTLLVTTSSSTYLAVGMFFVVTSVGITINLMRGNGSRRSAMLAGILLLTPIVIVTGLMLVPAAWTAISNFADATIFNKLESQSGIERTRWNDFAMQTFFDTAFLGAGVGSVRGSSFIVAVLSNMGIIGAALFSAFLVQMYRTPQRFAPAVRDRRHMKAGLAGGFILLPASAVSAVSVDLGLLFFVFAALASTLWPLTAEPVRANARVPRQQRLVGVAS